LKSEVTYQFPQDIKTIFKSYINEQFLKKKYQKLGSRKVEVKVDQLKENKWKVFVQREIPAKPPAAIKKFIGSWQKISQVEVWTENSDESYTCNIIFDNQGAPIKISAVLTLNSSEEGTFARNITDVECSIPFIGKKLTKFISEAGSKVLKEELKYVEVHV